MSSGTRILCGLLFLFWISENRLHSRNMDLRFEKISIDQGLSHSSVTAIHLDSQGFLWFGTQDGLNRFDGYNFTIYKNDYSDSTSISGNEIKTIAEDKDGYLWIGVSDGSVNRFDPFNQTFTKYPFTFNNSDNPIQDEILQIVTDSTNSIWVTTLSGKLNRFDRQTDSFIEIKIDPSLFMSPIIAMVAGRKNELWLGTSNHGLIQFNSKNLTYKPYLKNKKNGLCDNRITDLHFVNNQALWVATQNGICKLDPQKGTSSIYQKGQANSRGLLDNNIKMIFIDSHQSLWISTALGINIKSNEDNHFNVHKHNPSIQESIGTNVINDIFEDKSGIIWLGTYLDGINKFDRSKNLFTHFTYEQNNQNSISNNNVLSISEDSDGAIWIGTNQGLNEFIPEYNQFNRYLYRSGRGNLNHHVVRAVCEGPSGDIWCGTDGGGINRLNRLTGKFDYYQHDTKNSNTLSDNRVMQIYKDSDQTMWIATWNGLDRYNANRNNFDHFKHNPDKLTSLSDNRVQCIFEDKKGQVWIGTYNGLNMMDKSSGQCSRFTNDPLKPSSISDNKIQCIFEDKTGTLWIGTNHGLNKLNNDKGTFTRYTIKNGLKNDVIHGIVEDDTGILWISTNKGIVQFNPRKTDAIMFKSYDIYDGLSGNEFNTGAYLKSKDGQFYFGCPCGLNKFLPSRVKDNKHIPPVVITSFKKFDKNVELDQAIYRTEHIDLSYKENFFAFEFAALDFVNPNKNKYAYKLDGFNEEWIYCGQRNYASYTNLDGGKYTFNVRGANNDGVWNNRSTSIDIVITPPLWKNWWFISISIFIIVTIISAIIWNWQRQERIKREMLRLQVDDRTEDVRASLKKLRKTQNEAKNLAAKTRLLYDIGQRISNQLDVDTLLNNIVFSARDTFNYYNVMLMFKDEERNGLMIKSIAGGYKDVYPQDLLIKMGQGLTGKAAQFRQPQISNNVLQDSNYFKFKDDVTRSELAIPILSQSELIGVLDIQSDKLDEFTESDIEVFETFCSQVSAAINNANLFEQVQKELKERKKAEDLLRVSRDLLIAAKKETDNIFKNIEEGLFQINSKGEISAQYSKSLEGILGEEKLTGKTLINLLQHKITDKIYNSTIEYINLMFDEKIDEDTLDELNPLQEIEFNLNDDMGNYVDSKFMMFKFKRSYSKSGKITSLIISANDVSEQKKLAHQLEKSETEQKNQVEWMFSILHVEPALLREFMEISKKELNEITSLLKTTKNPKEYATIVEKILRVMGNLKNSASLLNIKLFERKAQKFEESVSRILKLKEIQGSDFISLVIQLEEMRSIIHEIENLIGRLSNIHSTFKSK